MPGRNARAGRRTPTPALISALPPDDLAAYEALRLNGFTYDFDNGRWYARRTKARVAFLLAAGYRRVG